MGFTMPASEATVQHRTEPVNIIRTARAFCGPSRGALHRPHFSGRELDRENDDEGRLHGSSPPRRSNRNDLDEWAGERHTDFLSPVIGRDLEDKHSAAFAVLFGMALPRGNQERRRTALKKLRF